MTFNRYATTLVLIITATCHKASYAASWGPFNIIEAKPSEEVWINPGFYSYHFDLSKNLNNNNIGLGAEYRYSTVNSVSIGRFNNSNRLISNYVTWNWQPLELGLVRLGAFIGAIDGYPARNGNWFLMALPVASYEYKNIGINLTLIPPYEDLIYASLTLQLKLKVF